MIHSHLWRGFFNYDMAHWYVWQDPIRRLAMCMHICDMTSSYVCFDSFTCVVWLIQIWDMTHSYPRHDSFIFWTWFIHARDMIHSYVCYHACIICVSWRITTWDVAHSYVWPKWCNCAHVRNITSKHIHANTHTCSDRNVTFMRVLDPILCVTWLIHMCDMIHWYICYYSFIRVPRVRHTIAMATAWHSYLWHDSIICVPWLI